MAKNRKMDQAEKEGMIIQNIQVGQLNRGHKSIDTWNSALRSAENVFQPRRKQLYDHMLDIDTDLTLLAAMQKRERGVTNVPLEWMGLTNENYMENFEAPWFNDYKKLIHSWTYYGHTLPEFKLEEGMFSEVNLVPRQNVDPELEIISKYMYGQEGYKYKELPYSNYILPIGKPTDLGLFSRIIPYVLLKRLNFGHFSQFNEMFGFPLRIYEYDPRDENSRIQIEAQAKSQGAAAYVVLPKGTGMRIQELNTQGSSQTFTGLHKILNDEITIVILGNTLTSSNDGVGSNALGKVHEGAEHDVNLSDRLMIEYVMNWDFKYFAMRHGYPLKGAKCRFIDMDELPKEKKAEILIKLSEQGYYVDPKYIYSELGIEVGEKKVVLPPVFNPDPVEPADPNTPPEAKSKPGLMTMLKLHNSYKHTCPNNPQMKANVKLSFEDDLQKIIEGIIAKVHAGTYVSGMVDEEYYKLMGEELWKGVEDAMGVSLANINNADPVRKILQQFRDNVFVFSGFKNYQFLRIASDLLIDENGNRKPFNKFRDDVLAINENYNVNYLRTEYQHAQATAQMADKEYRFRQDAGNVPNAKFITAGDERVRASHAKLDNLVMPLNDPRWRSFTPPLDWGCRCNKIATNDAVSSPADYQNLPEIPEMFNYSPLDDGIIFPKNHPYYEVAEKDRAAANNNFGLLLPGEDNIQANASWLNSLTSLFK